MQDKSIQWYFENVNESITIDVSTVGLEREINFIDSSQHVEKIFL